MPNRLTVEGAWIKIKKLEDISIGAIPASSSLLIGLISSSGLIKIQFFTILM